MSTREIEIYDESYEASSDLEQYRLVALQSDGKIGLGSTNAQGITQNNPLSGKAATVRHLGISRLDLNGTVAIGDPITGSAGLGVAASAGNQAVGFALQAGNAGDRIAVLMTGNFRVHA